MHMKIKTPLRVDESEQAIVDPDGRVILRLCWSGDQSHVERQLGFGRWICDLVNPELKKHLAIRMGAESQP